VTSNQNVDLIRTAYEAYARVDVAIMLEVIDPDLEWTYLAPGLDDPQPQVCHASYSVTRSAAAAKRPSVVIQPRA